MSSRIHDYCASMQFIYVYGGIEWTNPASPSYYGTCADPSRQGLSTVGGDANIVPTGQLYRILYYNGVVDGVSSYNTNAANIDVNGSSGLRLSLNKK